MTVKVIDKTAATEYPPGKVTAQMKNKFSSKQTAQSSVDDCHICTLGTKQGLHKLHNDKAKMDKISEKYILAL